MPSPASFTSESRVVFGRGGELRPDSTGGQSICDMGNGSGKEAVEGSSQKKEKCVFDQRTIRPSDQPHLANCSSRQAERKKRDGRERNLPFLCWQLMKLHPFPREVDMTDWCGLVLVEHEVSHYVTWETVQRERQREAVRKRKCVFDQQTIRSSEHHYQANCSSRQEGRERHRRERNLLLLSPMAIREGHRFGEESKSRGGCGLVCQASVLSLVTSQLVS